MQLAPLSVPSLGELSVKLLPVPKEKTPEFLIRVWLPDGQEMFYTTSPMLTRNGEPVPFTKFRGNASRYWRPDAAHEIGERLQSRGQVTRFQVEMP